MGEVLGGDVVGGTLGSSVGYVKVGWRVGMDDGGRLGIDDVGERVGETLGPSHGLRDG